ncbi:C40 family peptidase [Rhodococcus xishaensis]|uniref:Lytic transglycosylase n=1 Tax=Rhodococcus xishaensis TaxID=2487364 RepID=A0A438AVX6_9NOCA|nr:bifunctional lytic transglycosylase/C40 family peptidase [Rhodococcus xishaensis]RVW02873.1 lytic transglycosylase [Rhodococcus xishaensis]
MSLDPTAIIVAITAAAVAAIQGTDVPVPVKDYAADTIQAIDQLAPDLGEQVDSLIGLLPSEVRPQAERALVDFASTIPGVRVPDPPTPEALAAEASPEHATPAAAAPVVRVPAPIAGPVVTVPAVGSSELASLPAILPPNMTLGQVGSVAVFAPWLKKAGEICDGVNTPTLAALFAVENDFRYGPTAPVSLAGGRGPAKFMPSEWSKYGRDADGDGTAEILGVADSVMAAGHMLCDNYAQMDTWKKEGLVAGDTLDLALAAFNAGTRAVRKAGGVPSGIDDAADQSGPYVQAIRGSEEQFETLLSPFANSSLDINLPTAGIGGAAVQLAMRFLGLPYVWGGGDISGPTMGGFDCSGLTSAAVFAASGGKIVLPRTSEEQWGVGTEVPIAAAQPGDLVFGNWQEDGPSHVGVYMGNGLMVHAPTFGEVVKIGPVLAEVKARRVL